MKIQIFSIGIPFDKKTEIFKITNQNTEKWQK